MKKITLWYRHNPKTGKYEYNHFSSGWPCQYFPPKVGNFIEQWESWRQYRWAHEMAYLDGTTVKHRPEVDWK